MSTTEDGQAVTWHHAFGVQSGSGAVTYLDADNLLYPVGRHIVVNDPMDLKDKEGGSMQFIEMRGTVASIAISNDGKHVGVIDTGDSPDGPSRISVYRLDTRACVKVLRLSEAPEVDFKEVISIAWTPDDKHIVLQTGAPSWGLLYWAWHGNVNKPVCWSAVDEAVSRVSVCPTDASLVVTSGPALLRQWTLQRKDAKEPKFIERDISATDGAGGVDFRLEPSEEFTDHCWLRDMKAVKKAEEEAEDKAGEGDGEDSAKAAKLAARLLVGTSHGNLLVFARSGGDTGPFQLQHVMSDYWDGSKPATGVGDPEAGSSVHPGNPLCAHRQM